MILEIKYFKLYLGSTSLLSSILQVKNDVSDRPQFSVLMRGNKNYKPVVFLPAEKPNNILFWIRNTCIPLALEQWKQKKVLSCTVLTNQHSNSLHTK